MITFGSFIALFKRYVFDAKVFIIYYRTLSAPIEQIQTKLPVYIKNADPENNEYKEAGFPHYIIALLKKRFKQDYIKTIFAVDKDGKILGVGWTALYRDPKDGVKLLMAEKEALLQESFVIGKYRGNKIQTLLIQKRLEYLKSLGMSGAYAICDKNNIYSRKAIKNSGFKEVIRTRFYKLFTIGFQTQKKYNLYENKTSRKYYRI